MSNSDVGQEGLKLVDEGGAIERAVATQDDVILVWDLYDEVDVVIKWPLDGELGLVAQVNLTKNTVAKVELDALSGSILDTNLTRLALVSSVQLPEDQYLAISTSHISAFDLPGTRGTSRGQNLSSAVLIVGSHEEQNHHNNSNVEEGGSPNDGDFVYGHRIIVVKFAQAGTVVHVELTELEWLGADSLWVELEWCIGDVCITDVGGENKEILHCKVSNRLKLGCSEEAVKWREL